MEETVEAFVEAFGTIGYEPCDEGLLDESFEKIALFEVDRTVTHAARQVEDGGWTSKLGPAEDIGHATVDSLEGGAYGSVAAYLRRRRT